MISWKLPQECIIIELGGQVKESVLCIVNEIPAIEFIKPIRETYGAKVAVIVLYQYVEENFNFSTEEQDWIGKIYSVPQYYFEQIDSIKALDNETLRIKQKGLESKIGLQNSNILVGHDRLLKSVSDYRLSLELQVLYLMLVEKVVNECDLKFCMLGYGIFISEAFMSYCEHNHIMHLSFYVDRFNYERVISIGPDGHILGMEEVFDELRQGNTGFFSPETLAEADSRLDSFLNAPKMPYFTIAGTRSLLSAVKSVYCGGFGSIIKNILMNRKNKYDKVCGRLESSYRAMLKWPFKLARMFYLQKSSLLCKEPDISEKFIYVPLHYSPEITDMYYGRDYDHHESFIFHLSKRIPSGYRLYVKEHPAMLGQRPLSFYRKLKQQHNVTVLHPSVSTYDLINHGITLVVTGTAGWEAYLMNRPVVVLGDIFFNFLPGVLRVKLFDSDFSYKVEEYIDGFEGDADERRAAMRAGFICSPFVGKAINWRSHDIVASHAARYVKAQKELYDRSLAHHAALGVDPTEQH